MLWLVFDTNYWEIVVNNWKPSLPSHPKVIEFETIANVAMQFSVVMKTVRKIYRKTHQSVESLRCAMDKQIIFSSRELASVPKSQNTTIKMWWWWKYILTFKYSPSSTSRVSKTEIENFGKIKITISLLISRHTTAIVLAEKIS